MKGNITYDKAVESLHAVLKDEASESAIVSVEASRHTFGYIRSSLAIDGTLDTPTTMMLQNSLYSQGEFDSLNYSITPICESGFLVNVYDNTRSKCVWLVIHRQPSLEYGSSKIAPNWFIKHAWSIIGTITGNKNKTNILINEYAKLIGCIDWEDVPVEDDGLVYWIR